MLDCAIIGGGPAGLSAALVLGRSRREVLLFDNNEARNSVTQQSHGFLTRDGIKPGELKAIARQDLDKYPSVKIRPHAVVSVVKREDGTFQLESDQGETAFARKLIIATGLKEMKPDIDGLKEHYGKSLFSCPYCDGWEIRDQPLAVISEHPHAYHMVMTVYNWSQDLILCTNGASVLSEEQSETLRRKGIAIYEQPIRALQGKDGYLDKIVFQDGAEIARTGGFVGAHLGQATDIPLSLGCEMDEMGGIVTDSFGKTNIEGVYAAGDSSVVAPSQLIIAAAGGSRAAIGVNSAITLEDF